MQKVYLLLRQNRQTGPFTSEELLQFDLKPHDLIWIEGNSAGWYYPQEIEALRPHLSFLQNAASKTTDAADFSSPSWQTVSSPKKIFVAMPAASAAGQEPAATPVSKTAQSQPVTPSQPEEQKAQYTTGPAATETGDTNRIAEKKKSVMTAQPVVAAALLLSLGFGAWWALKPAAVQGVDNSLAAQPTTALPAETIEEEPVAEEPQAESTKTVAIKTQKSTEAVLTKKSVVATTVSSQPVEPTATNPVPAQTDNEAEPVAKEETAPSTEDNTTPATTEAPKEKKKLKDRIAELFRKKPEEKSTEAKPVEEEDGRRQSTRREAGSNLAQLVTVRFDVPNDWMMGIKGAKATLTNRSSETLLRAAVQVTYYNDDGDVLDKKTIAFANVKARQNQTVSVPDHQTATRLEYTVLSAQGASEPVAAR